MANLIADRVLGDALPEGTRLPTEKEMMAEYGVARTTVREALRLLESRGLVAIRPGSGGGPVVKRPEFSSLGNVLTLFLQLESATLSEVIDTRLALEPVAARLAAARITESQLDELAASLDAIRAAPEDLAVFAHHNARFHSVIYTATGNPVLRIVLETLLMLVRDVAPEEGHPEATRHAAVEAQQEVLDALRRRDEPAAAAAMTAFVEATARYYRRRLGSVISEPVHWQL
ncbi:FadR/GntR family transcriptional regulator [Pseudonocardia sp. WMMC193]|uniref:FadR/GntR family transcriptional regulator n=1 Tax=Pseudonocardia sp. WMMC193 TaxID=2911965 RepID=UPI001F4795FD|nr:FCD domain-containing protein [Pseudonocardia sp. WMMC193]MCF7553478.1 FCD domain-containing protein [Pseudonocardia sp. WMMC193]